MIRALVLGLSVLALTPITPLAPAGAPAAAPDPKPAETIRLLDATAAATVRVEYTLGYDKGEGPGASWDAYWPDAMRDDARSTDEGRFESLIRDERPLERVGYLIAPNQVVTSPLSIHPRFVKAIHVSANGKRIEARLGAAFKTQNAVRLDLASPLEGATPLSFDGPREEPWYAVRGVLQGGQLLRTIGALGGAAVRTEAGDTFSRISDDVLIVDKAGKPVAMWCTGRLPLDASWKVAPSAWPSLSAEELAKSHQGSESLAADSVLRAVVNFRSPRQDGGRGGYGRGRYDPYGEMGYGGYGETNMTEWNGSAILLNADTAVVMLGLRPQMTARLEKVRLFGPSGNVTATFAGTLKDFSGFLVKLEKPLGKPPALLEAPITSLRDQLLTRVDINVRGETRTVYTWPDRIRGFVLGYRRAVMPVTTAISSSSDPYGYGRYDMGSSQTTVLYTLDGRLAAIELPRREKVAVESDRSGMMRGMGRYGGQSEFVTAADLGKLSAGGAGAIDPENRPLSEEEENRLAWLGVELQAMDPELARASNVIELTNGGMTGGLVTYIYADSPAAKAGIQQGDILLRAHVDGQPKPLDIMGARDFAGDFAQLFAMMDRMPAEYFDQMPPLFSGAETPLTRQLTDIGFGTPFRVELFRDGKVTFKDFVITKGPDHFGSAKRFKSDAAGLTARNLTYEVRRFLQLQPEDPGIIVSKVERGEKSAVGGVRPYEIITHVNDTPLKSVDEFQNLIKDGGEFRFSVKRLSTSRIVKLKLETAAAAAERKAKDKDKVIGDDDMPAMPSFPIPPR